MGVNRIRNGRRVEGMNEGIERKKNKQWKKLKQRGKREKEYE